MYQYYNLDVVLLCGACITWTFAHKLKLPKQNESDATSPCHLMHKIFVRINSSLNKNKNSKRSHYNDIVICPYLVPSCGNGSSTKT